MRDFLDTIFDVTPYKTDSVRDRARMIYGIVVLLLILYTLFTLFVPAGIGSEKTFFESAQDDIVVTIYLIGFYGVSILTIVFLRRGEIDRAAWGPIIMWILGGCLNALRVGLIGSTNGVVFVALIILGGLLKDNRGIIWSLVISLVMMIIGLAVQRPNLDTPPLYIGDFDELLKTTPFEGITLALMFVGSAGLVYLFLYFSRINRSEGVAEVLANRNITADILSKIAAFVARRVSLDDMLPEMVQQINDRFDFIYHTQVFLIDDGGQDAQLVASTGEVGKLLLARRHSLPVGSQSVIGRVTFRGELVVAQIGGGIHKRNELLPDTAVEAAFPLRVGQRIIGALDVQSKYHGSFQDDDLNATFQAFADGISLAIDNISQFQKAEEQLSANQKLIEEARDALQEVERLNDRLTGRAWAAYLQDGGDQFGRSLDLENGESTQQSEWTSTLKEAMNLNMLVQGDEEDSRQVIAVPVRVRGHVIGAMEFELGADSVFSPEDFDLLNEVGDRFGMAVENARLVDQSQRIAQREALVNQISSRLQATNDVENMISEAAKSLRDTLKAGRVAIRLGSPPSTTHGGR